MSSNRVSASLSQSDRNAVMTAITTIKTKLPFLIDLTQEERKALPKMGDKSRAFVSKGCKVRFFEGTFSSEVGTFLF